MKWSNGEVRNIVLVVDDSPESLSMVSAAIEKAGMTVLVARDGETAIDLTHRVGPDVILMDALMPGLDGFETCAALKTGQDAVNTPVIFMTGLDDPEHILLGLEVGGVDYVTKPVNPDELVARLTVHLTNAKLIESARDAADANGRSVIAFTRSGERVWASPGAMKMIANHDDLFAEDDRVENQALREWLISLPQSPLSDAQPLRLERADSCLELRAAGLRVTGEVLVSVEDVGSRNPADDLMDMFGLTAREAEVLVWLSRGKTNRDIGQILTLSARTVNKHLEQIFHKLGVDNRTSAAVMADRICRG